MWFKHLHLYRVHDQASLSQQALEDALAVLAFRPVGRFEAKRIGFGAPAGRASERLVHELEGHRLLRLRRQERLLPNAVVAEELEERCEAFEAANGFAPPRREKQALKEKVVEELLPRAFTRSGHIDLWWDTRRSLIGIDCASRKRGEEMIDLLRQALGSLKVTPLSVKRPPAKTLTEWLRKPASRPQDLLLGDAVELRGDDDGVLRARAIDLDGEEIQTALAAGRQVSRLALSLEGQLSFTLQDDLALKSLKFDDQLLDQADDEVRGDDPVERLETEFALMASTLAALSERLIEWLGGEVETGPAPWHQDEAVEA
ncbi:recombination-associated protein RdgC [Halotalea alkalilenta]|uniref:Recombination-associated protein RdgC n=1 Tax=Halotalea alkalilenta TaxID=376489 RepID=A0A172YE74_9GAMM|nr:recombination-associated protein RdgC [Halotalea alkalilenta]ANF57559.1 recombinase [Halotalea alkalilenta]